MAALIIGIAGPAWAIDEDQMEADGWIKLFDEENVSGWRHARDPEAEVTWFVDPEDDSLTNDGDDGHNLATEDEWRDFEIMIDYRIPPGGNSGVYLRGRVEIQILDSSEQDTPRPGDDGAIYNQAPPKVLASNPIGEWNTLHAQYVDNRITASLNGVLIHDEQEVNEVTGGAMPGGVNEPGPIMLQGDHGKVWFRNVWLRPLDDNGEAAVDGP